MTSKNFQANHQTDCLTIDATSVGGPMIKLSKLAARTMALTTTTKACL